MMIEKIDSVALLTGLEREWRDLESYSNLPFTSWDWAMAWWAQLRENKLGVKDSLFVRAIRSDRGQLVAVAPMLISRRPSVGPLCLRELQFFGADPNITELRGLIALPEWRLDAYRALLAHAREHASQWDSLLLSGLPLDFPLGELWEFGQYEWRGRTTAYELDLPESWAAFRTGLRRNIKESLRKCYNSPKRDGYSLRVEIAERPEQVDLALRHFFEFHGARAALRETVRHHDIFDTREARRFLIDVCHRFAERGSLRIFQLLLDDRVVAVRIGFVAGDTLYLYYSGFDPDFSKYSVMTTVVAEAIQYAISNRMKKVNLSTGADVSKTRWDPVEVRVRHALLISPSRRGRVAHEIYRQTRRAVGYCPALARGLKFLARRSPLNDAL